MKPFTKPSLYRPAFRRLTGRLALILLLPFALVACDKEKDPDPPAELVDLEPRIDVRELWSTDLGGGMDRLRLGLRPTSFDGSQVYVADHGGDVVAIARASGKIQWRVRTRLPLSGGPAVGYGRVVVGSHDGDLVALNAEDGRELWKVNIRGEVLAPPAVGEAIVVVRSVDGRLRGLDAADGHELWLVEQPVPRLSVRGTSAPVIVGDLVLCGFDNGKVLAVTLKEGDTVWETAIAPSRGRTELERMVDIDSTVRVVGSDAFVVGFQAKAAMLALESGQIWWARDASSDRGLAVNDESVYFSSSTGDVIALSRRDGTPRWEQPALHRRGLSGPTLDGAYLIVADFEGYLHWLDAGTGDLLARQGTDGDRITNAPHASDGMVFVLTDSGTLAAFRSEQPTETGVPTAGAKQPAEQRAEQPAAEQPASDGDPGEQPSSPSGAEEPAPPPGNEERSTPPADDQSPAPPQETESPPDDGATADGG